MMYKIELDEILGEKTNLEDILKQKLFVGDLVQVWQNNIIIDTCYIVKQTENLNNTSKYLAKGSYIYDFKDGLCYNGDGKCEIKLIEKYE